MVSLGFVERVVRWQVEGRMRECLSSTLTLDGRWGLNDHFIAVSATAVFRDTINICRDRDLGVISRDVG
jgi:hypothetical protein